MEMRVFSSVLRRPYELVNSGRLQAQGMNVCRSRFASKPSVQ